MPMIAEAGVTSCLQSRLALKFLLTATFLYLFFLVHGKQTDERQCQCSFQGVTVGAGH